MKINELNKRDLPDFTQLSETGKLDFELIVSASINKSRTFVIAHPEYNLSNVEYSKYMGYYEKRMDYYSIAQIVGHKEFYGLDFIVNEVDNLSLQNMMAMAYQKQVIPDNLPVFGLTAGLPVTLVELVGSNGKSVGLDHFGYSAPYKVLDENFGFSGKHVAQEVLKFIRG